MSLQQYFLEQERVRTAKAEREAASLKLELARVRERMAEIRSQHEPLNSITESREERRRHLCTAFYVVVGRWPQEGEV